MCQEQHGLQFVKGHGLQLVSLQTASILDKMAKRSETAYQELKPRRNLAKPGEDKMNIRLCP